VRLTEVREARRSALTIVAGLATSVASPYARLLSAQAPVVRDSAQWAAIRKSVWQTVYYRTFDSVVVSAGLSRLRSSALPEGQREVRIWVGGGFTTPEDLYRFVDDRGQVSGELVQYWHVGAVDGLDSVERRLREMDDDLMLSSLRGSCSRFSTGARMYTCRTDFIRPPNWAAVLQHAEAAGLWTLPEQWIPPDGMQVLDGWGMTVELRDGIRYRAYHYNNPDSRTPSPENVNAMAIRVSLGAIDSLRKTPDVVKSYRGITTGVYHSEFVDCATGARWEFYNDLRSLAAGSRVSFQPASDSTARYVVEVVGELTPEWLARRWSSKYPKVLQIFRLVSVRPAIDGACPNER
jgi:hypothetical protein